MMQEVYAVMVRCSAMDCDNVVACYAEQVHAQQHVDLAMAWLRDRDAAAVQADLYRPADLVDAIDADIVRGLICNAVSPYDRNFSHHASHYYVSPAPYVLHVDQFLERFPPTEDTV